MTERQKRISSCKQGMFSSYRRNIYYGDVPYDDFSGEVRSRTNKS